jgi:hypothetical protein
MMPIFKTMYNNAHQKLELILPFNPSRQSPPVFPHKKSPPVFLYKKKPGEKRVPEEKSEHSALFSAFFSSIPSKFILFIWAM